MELFCIIQRINFCDRCSHVHSFIPFYGNIQPFNKFSSIREIGQRAGAQILHSGIVGLIPSTPGSTEHHHELQGMMPKPKYFPVCVSLCQAWEQHTKIKQTQPLLSANSQMSETISEVLCIEVKFLTQVLQREDELFIKCLSSVNMYVNIFTSIIINTCRMYINV